MLVNVNRDDENIQSFYGTKLDKINGFINRWKPISIWKNFHLT